MLRRGRSAVVHYTTAAVIVIAAALWLPQLGSELARQTGLGEAFVGSLFVAATMSLPEIVVSLAAVRLGLALGEAKPAMAFARSSFRSRRFQRGPLAGDRRGSGHRIPGANVQPESAAACDIDVLMSAS